MNWKTVITLMVLTGIFFVIGLYAGGGVYLMLTGGDFRQAALTTLPGAGAFSMTSHHKMFLPWAWCVTVALTFLPPGLTFVALLAGGNKKMALHGDASFASKKELNAFKYRGNYQ